MLGIFMNGPQRLIAPGRDKLVDSGMKGVVEGRGHSRIFDGKAGGNDEMMCLDMIKPLRQGQGRQVIRSFARLSRQIVLIRQQIPI